MIALWLAWKARRLAKYRAQARRQMHAVQRSNSSYDAVTRQMDEEWYL